MRLIDIEICPNLNRPDTDVVYRYVSISIVDDSIAVTPDELDVLIMKLQVASDALKSHKAKS